MEKGLYGKNTILLVTDNAENYAIKDGTKLTSDQWYTRRKCQIMGIIVYFWNGKKNCLSHFVLSPQNVKKNAEFSIQEMKRLIKTKLDGRVSKIDKLICWSDGSTKEFLNATMFGSMCDVAKELNIPIRGREYISKHEISKAYIDM